MTIELQHVWGNLIVIDIFFGGLGGACLALAAIAIYSKRLLPLFAPWSGAAFREATVEAASSKRVFALAMSASGVVFIGLGVLMLLLDLLHPEAVLHLLGNPSSWMFWGTIFLTVTLISGALYAWAQAVPLLEWLYNKASLRKGMYWLAWLADRLANTGRSLQRIERFTGPIAGIFGFAYALYTGLLLTMAPAIPFWHTPALPCLFTFSAFSAAAAYALLILAVIRFSRGSANQGVQGADVGLILFEILILLAYFNFARMGSIGAKASVDFLLGQAGFWVGVLVLGLIVPLALELLSLRHRGSHPRLNALLSVTSGALVIVGVFLLRYYVVHAGVLEFPW